MIHSIRHARRERGPKMPRVITGGLRRWLSEAASRGTRASRTRSASALSTERSHWDRCTVLQERSTRK